MNLRTLLNNGDANRLDAAFQKAQLGELLNRLGGGGSVDIAALTAATVATANAATQGGTYVQADVQSIATLANALKTAVNAIIVDLGSLRTGALAVGGVTEANLSPSSSVVTLANAPSALINVVAAGTVAGAKKIRKGPISGPQLVAPASGEVVWDGSKKILVSTADGVTTVDVTYAKAADETISILQADADQVA